MGSFTLNILYRLYVKYGESVAKCESRSRLTLPPRGLQPARHLCPWDSSGENTGVGCYFLLQGIFLTQGSNLGLPHCRQILHRLSLQRSPQAQQR